MSTSVNKSTISGRRIAFTILIVVSSLIAPIAIFVGYSLLHQSRRAAAGSVLGVGSEPAFPIKDNQLWFPVLHFDGMFGGGTYECEIKWMDLATGETHDTGLRVPNEVVRVHWDDDQLYFWTDTAVYERQGSSLKKVAKLLPQNSTLVTSPFVYNGQVTMVVEMPDSRFRLHHLEGADWTVGREILLPSQNPTGAGAPGFGPATSGSTAGVARTPQRLGVIQQGAQTHLLLQSTIWSTALPYFAAYRSGFEFADTQEGVPDALTPQNVPQLGTGWEPVPPSSPDSRFYSMTCDRGGLLLTSHRSGRFGQQYEHLRRFSDGRWTPLAGLKAVEDNNLARSIISGSDGQAYLAEVNGAWGSADLFPINGNIVLSDRPVLPSHEFQDLLRQLEYYLVLLVGLLSYPAILLLGMATCVRRHSTYQFGLQQVRLASPFRRSLAWLVDWTCIGSLCLLSAFLHLKIMGDDPETISQIARQLAQIQQRIQSYPLNIVFAPMFLLRFTVLGQNIDWQTAGLFVLVLSIDTLFVLWSFKVYAESRYGATLGKWLFGIQTVQTSLRPCTLQKVIVRDVLWYVDFPLALTPIPAAISMMLSDCGQRCGDRVADTIVIRKGTLQNLTSNPVTTSESNLKRRSTFTAERV